MNQAIQTPISQAMAQGIVSRQELKRLMRRSNRPAVSRLIGLAILLGFTGFCVSQAMETAWIWLAMFFHGIVIVHLFSLQHECVHYTVFRTRWLNDVVGSLCGWIIVVPNRFFRYEHCNHHTYTNLKSKDPELIELPRSLWQYIFYLSSWPYWKGKILELVRHVGGRISDVEAAFVPREEWATIILEARIMSLGYLVIVGMCTYSGWWAPLWYWWLPLLLGEPVMRAIRVTEHVGRPNVDDLRANTRTCLVSAPLRFLCWNMNFHAEHHYASSVPFHALPELHRKLAQQVMVEPHGYLGAHIDIIRQIIAGRSVSRSSASSDQ
jgi:fatty acid desaturase